MILLDTNILSALMRDPPDAAVVAWLDKQDAARIWTTAVTVFEVRFGLARMAVGRNRVALEAAFEDLLREDLAGRVARYPTRPPTVTSSSRPSHTSTSTSSWMCSGRSAWPLATPLLAISSARSSTVG